MKRTANTIPASAARSYRCFYEPASSESGLLPHVDLDAEDGSAALHAAHTKTGHPIARVERLERAS
ncbi:hypothetical protein [Variovorax paradoxus]|uniref:hypothetical protein n=1 Tax=Variovorax paradoxus TaxID=34073 RepID=UPI0007805B71|nr:hypothetical protein [Variovorax paradoxus]